ncbi:MAG TPA: sulfatase-like hydrolase/transferase [Spirochaetia bacterium]|nr:sulfatase-like hydrolase/transferase [Spirochaetia bacterium]
MQRPNVLVIQTDQQRWDTVGAGGHPLVKTPNLDRLAAAGTLFNNAYANCPVCMPSRQSMLSGRYPGTLGVRCNGIEMPQHVECIHNVLAGHGYHTAQLGKLHFLNHASPYRDHREPHPDYGFDTCIVSDEPGCYDDPYIAWVARNDPAAVDTCRVDTPPAWTGPPVSVHPRNTHQPYVFGGPEAYTHSAFVAEMTTDYLRTRAARAKEGEPFFAIAGFYAPHAPLNPPPRFLDRYNPNDMPLPVRAEDENFFDPDSGLPVTDAQWKIIKQHYYALISHVDDCIGRILSALDALGLTDDTLIIFTSDHGENLGDHGLIQKSQWFDSSTRVPLIVKPPRSAGTGGTVADDFVELVDIAPTITEYCGVPTPPFFQGRSLRTRLRAPKMADPGARESAYFEHGVPGGAGYRAVRTERYLYARHRDGSERLYDLATDPDQIVNLLQNADPTKPASTLLAEARGELLARILAADPAYPKRTANY